MTESLPGLARDMLALFENELKGQRFGDLDEAALREHADDVSRRATALEEKRAELEERRAELEIARGELLRLAEQSLAYARIYAESLKGSPELEDSHALAARLDELKPRARSKARRRPKTQKPPKNEPPKVEAELPFAAAN